MGFDPEEIEAEQRARASEKTDAIIEALESIDRSLKTIAVILIDHCPQQIAMTAVGEDAVLEASNEKAKSALLNEVAAVANEATDTEAWG